MAVELARLVLGMVHWFDNLESCYYREDSRTWESDVEDLWRDLVRARELAEKLGLTKTLQRVGIALKNLEEGEVCPGTAWDIMEALLLELAEKHDARR